MFRLKYLPNIRKDEKIIFFLRRHWFVMVKIVIFYIFLACLPLLFYYVLFYDAKIWIDNQIAIVFLRLLIFTYYLFWWMLFYYAWLDYFLDIWIVTNRRVLNIEQNGLFNRFMAENKLYRIQDISSQQQGMLPTFFNYGKVSIQTAGAKNVVVFEQVPRPHYIARETIKLVEWRKKIVAKTMDNIDKINKMERVE